MTMKTTEYRTLQGGFLPSFPLDNGEQVARIQRKATGSLYRWTSGNGYRLDQQLAEDAIQEALWTLYRNPQAALRTRANGIPIHGHVSGLARRYYYRQVLKGNRFPLTDTQEDKEGRELLDQTFRQEDFADVVALKEDIKRLPEHLRQVADLMVRGYTNREIARIVNTSERTLYRQIAKIQRDLSSTNDQWIEATIADRKEENREFVEVGMQALYLNTFGID